MNPAPPQFTAAQLARIFGRQRQAVARALADVPADGCAAVCGAAVKAWSLAALPFALQKELEQTAQRLGYRSAQSLLAAPAPVAGRPAVPLSAVAQSALDKAAKLQRALARMLARQHDPALTAAELEQIGVADYVREFGHVVTTRTIRALFKRTVTRAHAAGGASFESLQLYLAERPALKTPVKPAISLESESEFRALHDVIASFANPSAPAHAEKSYLWLCAYEMFEEKLADGRAPNKLRRALVKFLERNAPFLVAAGNAAPGDLLRIQFKRKHDKWLACNCDAKALADARAENSGHFRDPELSTNDRDKLVARAVFDCGGRVAQAWRELNERGELSAGITGYYLSNPARKSHVPRAILESVKGEVASMYDLHHGPRQARLNGPHISRDWSRVHSLDWMQADDFTFPIYYRAPHNAGGWLFMRGQVLLMVDLRSTRILGFLLLSERNYTARAIRTLITKACDEHGLPRKGFYFENGIWKKSKIITGAKDAPPLSWGETEMGLREFGLKFVHAQLPRAKPVERVGGLLQNLMEGLPGYVGRNEMVEKFERVQKLKRDAERGDPAAVAQFMDEDQWSEQLEKLCARYNSAPQNGKMTQGRSPDETFDDCLNLADPPVKFSPQCRYLLANHKRPVRVLSKGILIDKGYYYGAGIAGRQGQTLLAWIDPETPEFITVTDMNRKNAVTVPRALDVPAMDATADQLAAAHRQIAEFTGHTKARYRILKAARPVVFRDMVADRDTVELGVQIDGQREALEAAQREQSRPGAKPVSIATPHGRLGAPVPPDGLRGPETSPVRSGTP